MRNFYSLSNKAKLSLLDIGGENVDGKRVFAPNPQVAEGRDYYFGMNYDIDFRPSPTAFVNAWQFKGRYENSAWIHSVTKSDFSYHRMCLEFNRYQRLFTKQKAILTLKIATFQGKTTFKTDSLGTSLPRDQFLYDIGGYGSLRGYKYREFQNGNRMILLNWNYFFNGSFFPKTFLTKIWGLGRLFRTGDLMLLADAGYVWNVDHNKPLFNFSTFGLKDLKADAGLGLAFTEWIRFEAAFPMIKGTQSRRGDYAIYLRVTPKF
jgi:outer membrane protein assembly factor BamA